MPALETMDLRQDAVLRTATTADQYGEYRASPSKAIKCRWEDTNVESSDALGNPINLVANVVVAQSIPVGSYLWLGNIKAMPATVTWLRVTTRHVTPDIKNRNTRWTLGLTRSSDKAPSA